MSLRVLRCPPGGPLRLRPGKAGSAAPACEESNDADWLIAKGKLTLEQPWLK